MALDAGIEDELNTGGPTPEIVSNDTSAPNRRGRGSAPSSRAPPSSKFQEVGASSAAYNAGAAAAIKCFPPRVVQLKPYDISQQTNSGTHLAAPAPAPTSLPAFELPAIARGPRKPITVAELEAQMMQNVIRE